MEQAALSDPSLQPLKLIWTNDPSDKITPRVWACTTQAPCSDVFPSRYEREKGKVRDHDRGWVLAASMRGGRMHSIIVQFARCSIL